MLELAMLALFAFDVNGALTEMEQAVIRSDQAALERLAHAFREEFEAGSGEKSELLRYAFAYTKFRLASFHEHGSRPYQAVLEEAEKELNTLTDRHPESAEALALLATVNGWLITDMWSALRRGPSADSLYRRAREAEPDNPRVAMHQGVSRIFRPKFVGGGLDKAEAELDEALALFEKEPRDKRWPNGGLAEIHVWLGQVMVQKGDFDRARGYYQQALALEPDYHWVREVLLPELAAGEAKAGSVQERIKAATASR